MFLVTDIKDYLYITSHRIIHKKFSKRLLPCVIWNWFYRASVFESLRTDISLCVYYYRIGSAVCDGVTTIIIIREGPLLMTCERVTLVCWSPNRTLPQCNSIKHDVNYRFETTCMNHFYICYSTAWFLNKVAVAIL